MLAMLLHEFPYHESQRCGLCNSKSQRLISVYGAKYRSDELAVGTGPNDHAAADAAPDSTIHFGIYR